MEDSLDVTLGDNLEGHVGPQVKAEIIPPISPRFPQPYMCSLTARKVKGSRTGVSDPNSALRAADSRGRLSPHKPLHSRMSCGLE